MWRAGLCAWRCSEAEVVVVVGVAAGEFEEVGVFAEDVDADGDVVAIEAIAVGVGDALSDEVVGGLGSDAGFYGFAEVEGLGGADEFDGEDVFDAVEDFVELYGGGSAHADVVFLAERGGDGVDASGGGEDLAFVDECGGGVLGDHVAAVEAGIAHEEFGESVFSGEEQVGTSFGEAGEIGEGDGEVVERRGEGRAVEETAADGDDVGVGVVVGGTEEDGVVGDAIDFALEDGGDVGEGVAEGAVDVSGTAERVRILDFVAGGVGGEDFAVAHVVADVGGAALGAGMGADEVHAGVGGVDGAVRGFEGDGVDEVGKIDEAGGADDDVGAIGGHELGAVDECEPFLGGEAHGFESDFCE